MRQQLFNKIKEALISVLPVSLIVIILSFTPLLNQITSYERGIFAICSILLIIGIGLFNLGADLAMQPMGEQVGSTIVKSKKIIIILLVTFVLGLLVTVAEPDLSVLAEQVKPAGIDKFELIISIGIGVGIFLVISVFKIIFKKDLSLILLFFYCALFSITCLLILNGKEDFLALSFDSGGVTTGPITVPFIMALGVGIASTIGGKKSSENSFGLISLCSIGPIIAILLLGLGSNGNFPFTDPKYEVTNNFISDFFSHFLSIMGEVGLALGLIVIFFLIIQIVHLKLPKTKLIQIGVGILYTYFGLVIFLTSVNIGFLPIGYKIGITLSSNPVVLIVFGFILGMVVVLAEPAIHVLTKQVEEITNGGVSKKSMLIALCIGVGISIGLSMIRIVFEFSILYYLIPGYLISLGLSLFVPKIYTAIAFDSGGVASGPLTSSFILPLAIGACITSSSEAAVLTNGFGIVAMVAMTPLITIQLLGFRSIIKTNLEKKARMRKILSADDEQIINFM